MPDQAFDMCLTGHDMSVIQSTVRVHNNPIPVSVLRKTLAFLILLYKRDNNMTFNLGVNNLAKFFPNIVPFEFIIFSVYLKSDKVHVHAFPYCIWAGT